LRVNFDYAADDVENRIGVVSLAANFAALLEPEDGRDVCKLGTFTIAEQSRFVFDVGEKTTEV
jgi:hypothetical protein